MADYYTQCSFILPVTDEEERNSIVKVLADPENMAPDEWFDDPDFKTFEINYELVEGGLWFWATESFDPYALGRLIQEAAPSVLPFSWTFAQTCSKPRLDAYSGGYVRVTESQVEVVTAGDLL